MAFVRADFAQASVADGNTPKLYCYQSTTDTLATILASDYFAEVEENLNDDALIYAVATDQAQWLKVLSTDPVETTQLTGSSMVKFAGSHTTLGGAAAEAVTITGLLTTDLVFTQLKAQGATPRTILYAVPTANTLTVTFSGDPSTDHVFYYNVIRHVENG